MYLTEAAVLESVHPATSLVPSYSGGAVTLVGRFFTQTNQTQCVFADNDGVFGIRPATFINATLFTCIAPSHMFGTINVSLTDASVYTEPDTWVPFQYICTYTVLSPCDVS